MNYRFSIIIMSGLLLMSGCGRNPSATANAQRSLKSVPVLVEKAVHRNLEEYIYLTGRLEGLTDILFLSETSGKVVIINKKLGEWIDQGEELGAIDNADYKSRLEQARASVLAAEAALDVAELQMQTSETLFRNGSISQVEYSRSLSSLKSAQAAYDGTRAAAEQAQKAYDNSRFLAPVAGFIAELHISPGEMVAPGSPLCSIVDSQKLKIKTGVGQKNVQKIKTNQPVMVRYPDSNLNLPGKISGIGIRPNRSSGLYPVEIELDNEKNLLFPGMIVEISVLSNIFQDVIYTSLNNVLQEYDNYYLYIVNEDGQAEKREIDLGPVVGENVVIRSGLNSQDRLVIEGMENLSQGTPVEIRQPLE
ncbi:MAG: efflux RND transporter periplasmic adaptor subunit [Candidatus Cloacimonetes bacterium]|nr:efflux RND transporter periplasmic adaptor subunit [Candidatus Cloacimonadota bacterium]